MIARSEIRPGPARYFDSRKAFLAREFSRRNNRLTPGGTVMTAWRAERAMPRFLFWFGPPRWPSWCRCGSRRAARSCAGLHTTTTRTPDDLHSGPVSWGCRSGAADANESSPAAVPVTLGRPPPSPNRGLTGLHPVGPAGPPRPRAPTGLRGPSGFSSRYAFLRLSSAYVRSLKWLIRAMGLIGGTPLPRINRGALINHAISAK